MMAAETPIRPQISILINNYNYGHFVAEAIDSALKQVDVTVEVVVVDDGSTDHSRTVIEAYGDRIVSVFKANGGQSSAFNAGIAASRGEILCFLDADDYCAPDKAIRVIEYFSQYPEAGWLFHELNDVDGEGNPLNLGDRSMIRTFASKDFRPEMHRGQHMPFLPATSGLCFRRSILSRIAPVPEALRISADNFLRLAAMSLAPGLLVPDQLAVHRIHGNNLYEQRRDIRYLHAETDLKTSFYLRQLLPEVSPFTDRLFAYALGQLAGRTGLGCASRLPESKAYLMRYLSWQAGLDVMPRMLYNYARSTFAALAHP